MCVVTLGFSEKSGILVVDEDIRFDYNIMYSSNVTVLQCVRLSHENWIWSASVLHGEHEISFTVWSAERR